MRGLLPLLKHKGNEKVLEPIVELVEHINFHFFFKSSGNVHSPFEWTKEKKRGQVSLKVSGVDKSLKKQEHEAPKVEKSSKDFLAIVDTFRVFGVQLREAIAQN
jgi:hypothetical protein